MLTEFVDLWCVAQFWWIQLGSLTCVSLKSFTPTQYTVAPSWRDRLACHWMRVQCPRKERNRPQKPLDYYWGHTEAIRLLLGTHRSHSITAGRSGLAIGDTGESPVGRQGWDGPKYRPTPLTKRPFPLTSPAPTLFYATQNTYYWLYFQKLCFLISLTDFYTTPCDLYSHSWCLVFETILKCLLYSSNVFRKSNFVLGVIKCQSL